MIWQGDTPKGNEFRMECRDGTSDENICRLVANMDEYGLGAHEFDGVAIDIGAHIGSVTVPLLIDNPGLIVVAVEPVQENLEMLRRNIELNDLLDRVTILPVAAGLDGITEVAHGWVGKHRHVGNLGEGEPEFVHKVMSMSLGWIIGSTDRPVSLLKLDCEGCEWEVLDDPAILNVEMIVGEYHGKGMETGRERVTALLDRTHWVTFYDWVFTAVRK